MIRDALRSTIFASVLFVGLGAAAWSTGRPFLFPSLGPTAYVYAVATREGRPSAARVFGGHAIGAVAGLAAYHALAGGATLSTGLAPASAPTASLAAAALVSVAATTLGMVATGLGHSPACATTLIVSLGILPAIVDGVFILLAVLLLVVLEAGLRRLLASVSPGAAWGS